MLFLVWSLCDYAKFSASLYRKCHCVIVSNRTIIRNSGLGQKSCRMSCTIFKPKPQEPENASIRIEILTNTIVRMFYFEDWEACTKHDYISTNIKKQIKKESYIVINIYYCSTISWKPTKPAEKKPESILLASDLFNYVNEIIYLNNTAIMAILHFNGKASTWSPRRRKGKLKLII